MITVYFDFLCPFAWRGVELLAALEVAFKPCHYSLVQGNHAENAGLPRHKPVWKLSEQPLDAGDYTSASLEAFLASHAAKHQGAKAHLRFILELFRARHLHQKELDTQTILQAAQSANLDLEAFNLARADESTRRNELEQDLVQAGELAVFGTPTIQLENSTAAYFRFAKLPESKEAQETLWQMYQSVLHSEAQIETIKRPRK
ncbi:MAG: DsbA family protein [Deinococcales bacterium]